MGVITRFSVTGFRNLRDVELALSPSCNVFVGPNGAGKTALLEALHYCVRGRSFRTGQPLDLLPWDGDMFLVRMGLESDGLEHSAAVQRERSRTQQVRWDDESSKGFSRLSALLPLQVIEPTASELVLGAPALRRRWWDWGSFHVEHAYLFSWRQYTKALRQRNAVLKSWQRDGRSSSLDRLLTTYTEQLCIHGEAVAKARDRFLSSWMPLFHRRLVALLPGLGEMEVSARPYGSSRPMALHELLSETGGREVKSGVTVYGPHKADVELTYQLRPFKDVASRGQAKLVSMAMILALAEVVAQRGGRRSIFLLDDIFAELDPDSLSRLANGIEATGGQIFLTAPDLNTVPEWLVEKDAATTAVFHVEHGRVSRGISA